MTSLLYLIKNRKSEDTILCICVFSLKKQIVCQDKRTPLSTLKWRRKEHKYIDLCILYNVLYLTFKIMITERSYCRGPVKNAHPHQYCNYQVFNCQNFWVLMCVNEKIILYFQPQSIKKSYANISSLEMQIQAKIINILV